MHGRPPASGRRPVSRRLASQYTTDKKASSLLASTLGPIQQKRIVDLIHDELASDLSVARLADEVRLSAHHFTRAFKATFGVTPHRYVQQRRVQAAAESLQREPRRSIAEIALAYGFASQSHMTDVMHRGLGMTPRMLRRSGS